MKHSIKQRAKLVPKSIKLRINYLHKLLILFKGRSTGRVHFRKYKRLNYRSIMMYCFIKLEFNKKQIIK